MANFYAKEIQGATPSSPGTQGLTDLGMTTDKAIHVTLRTVEYNAQAINDTIELCNVRPGTRIISITAVTNVSLGSTTLDIGTDTDADAFASGVTLSTNVRKDVMQGLVYDNFGVNKPFSKLKLTVKAAAMPTATTNPVGSLQFIILTSDRVM